MSFVRVLVLLLWSVLAVGCPSPKARPFFLRSLTVRVVEARTGDPLAGVPVSYMVTTRMSRFSRPSPAGPRVDVGPRHAVRVRGVTDASGDVTFRVGEVPLNAMEEFRSENILINVEGDMTAPLAETVRRIEEESCRSGHPLCRVPVEDVDIVWRAAQDGTDARAQILRRPMPQFEGMLLVVLTDPPTEGMTSWIGKGEPYVLRYHHSMYRGPETVVVELQGIGPRGPELMK